MIINLLRTVAFLLLVFIFVRILKNAMNAQRRIREHENEEPEDELPPPQDLVQCKVCETYLSADNPERCDRDDCPF